MSAILSSKRQHETSTSRGTKLEGVQNAAVDFSSGLLRFEGEIPFTTLTARGEALGYHLSADAPVAAPLPQHAAGALEGFARCLFARLETRLALLGGVSLLVILNGLRPFQLKV